MDLTKIVLPTFILERRSLLEMYADFFAHPDIFTEISEKESPEERIIQVLKWYLSAFRLVLVFSYFMFNLIISVRVEKPQLPRNLTTQY